MGSKPFEFKAEDVKKVARGLVIAIAAAAVTYFADVIVPQLSHAGTGPSLFAAAVLGAFIDAGRRWINDNR